MNNHPVKNPELVNKSIWDQAIRRVKCPECRCDAGYYCEVLPGRKTAGRKR